MRERCFRKSSTVQRLRGGPARPSLDGFAESLLAQGYAPDTGGSYLHAAAHLASWAARRGTAITALDEARLVRFVRHLPRCRCRGWRRGGHKRVAFRVHAFLRYLRGAGVALAPDPRTRRVVALTWHAREQSDGTRDSSSNAAPSTRSKKR